MGPVVRARVGVCAAVVIVLVTLLLPAAAARAAVIFQTSLSPGAPATGGASVYQEQYLGVRFQLAQPTDVTHVGLRMRPTVSGSVFGAIVRLSSVDDFPDSIHPFNTPDVLATTLLPIPQETADVTAEIGPITLSAGTYALVFGSGEFGASGNAAATQNNPPAGPQSYFFWNAGTVEYVNGGYGNVRLYVLGEVPEPSSAAAVIAVVAVAGMTARQSRRRRALRA